MSNESALMRKFRINKDYMDIGCNIYKKSSISIRKGVTILVGCNGMGKTTLIRQLSGILRKEKIPFIEFNNLTDGGNTARSFALSRNDLAFFAKSALSSEGENIMLNVDNFASRIASFIATNEKISKELWIFIDAVDSGLSIDNICDLKELFKVIIDHDPDNDIFIVVSTNAFEFARNEECFDVYRGRYTKFKSYEKYRNFILETRKEKDARRYEK